MSTAQNESNIRKVALTSLSGTSIEWYDFFLYGAAAGLVFPKLFFGEVDATTALILSYMTFAAGFIARPVGGIIFGHFGDIVGRKKTLVIALMLMGVSSTLIGFLPTYETIGIAAPILLTFLRFCQGIAIGGQWGGAMLLVTESAPSNRRGYYGAYAQAGAPMGVILANIAFISVSLLTTEESFLTWGWRIPFIISFVLVIISMYIQLKLEDTKAFKELEAAKESDEDGSKVIKTSPILEALKRYPKRISLAAGAFLSVQVTFYILVAFVLAYGVETTDLSRNDLLTAVLIGSAIMVPTQFFFSDYSDKKGRKGIFMAGALLTAIWAFFLFPLIDSGNFFLVILGVTGGLTFFGYDVWASSCFFCRTFYNGSKILRRIPWIPNWRNYWRIIRTNNCNITLDKL